MEDCAEFTVAVNNCCKSVFRLGQICIGQSQKISWNANRKKSAPAYLLFLRKHITILCLSVFVYSKLVLFKGLGLRGEYQLHPVIS